MNAVYMCESTESEEMLHGRAAQNTRLTHTHKRCLSASLWCLAVGGEHPLLRPWPGYAALASAAATTRAYLHTCSATPPIIL